MMEKRVIAPGVLIEALPREWPLIICRDCERPLRTCDICLALTRTGVDIFYLHCRVCRPCDERRQSWLVKKRASGICIATEACTYPAKGNTAYCGHHRRIRSHEAHKRHALARVAAAA